MCVVALTGHRPNKLWGYDLADPHYREVERRLRIILEEVGADTVLSGMALGFDQIGARVAIDMGVELVACVPFAGQESRWPTASQVEYRRILEQADQVVTVCDGAYAAWKMQRRNEYMVDHADLVIALWDGTPGGTENCLRYARSKDMRCLRINPTKL